MNKFFTLTLLAAALIFAGTTQASARTQAQSASHARVAHQTLQSSPQTYALTGQTFKAKPAIRSYERHARLIKGGRAAR